MAQGRETHGGDEIHPGSAAAESMSMEGPRSAQLPECYHRAEFLEGQANVHTHVYSCVHVQPAKDHGRKPGTQAKRHPAAQRTPPPTSEEA